MPAKKPRATVTSDAAAQIVSAVPERASEELSRKIGITETILRDAHQSLMATRMSTEDMLPVMDALDEIGYHSLEVWGGATFYS